MVNKRKKKGKKNNQDIRKYGLVHPPPQRSNAQLQPSPSTIVNKSQLISYLPTPPHPPQLPFPPRETL